jgi:glycosyltransferase involved in cell wall biosynthesis
MIYLHMRYVGDELSHPADGKVPDNTSLPLVIATILREEGNTGVHTHIRQLNRYIGERGTEVMLITPFSWGQLLTYPVFGFRRLVLDRCSRSAGVAWYRHWHEVFLRNALRRHLAEVGDCVVYAQGPLEARAALRARRGPHQRVVLAAHFGMSQADRYADSRQIRRDGRAFRAIRQLERETIPQVDRLMYVSRWGRDALVGWLPEAAAVPSAVIGNFISPSLATRREPLGDLVSTGRLELVKNHRFILEVLAEAKRAGRIVTLDLFGDGPCRQDLVRQAHSLGLDEQVRFRGFRPDVRDFLPGYRVYVHASYLEAQPLAIMEAMDAGLPIVAGGIGPIAELCDDGIEARFWPLDDPAQAAVVLMDLLDCEPERLKAARAARERFHRDYDADVVGPKLLSFLMGTAPGPRALFQGAPTP